MLYLTDVLFCLFFYSTLRRKKKCIRYMDGADEADHSEDNLGSAGSVGETRSPDSKVDASSDSEADDDEGATSASDLGLSSPGLSLSSLASPAILPSPSTSLASPCPLTPSPATPSASFNHDKLGTSSSSTCSLLSATTLSSGLSLGLSYPILPGPSPSGSLAQLPPPHRHPIGTNPHDINNPLSVNQLTGQCSSNKDKAPKAPDNNSHAIVSVT